MTNGCPVIVIAYYVVIQLFVYSKQFLSNRGDHYCIRNHVTEYQRHVASMI